VQLSKTRIVAYYDGRAVTKLFHHKF